MATHESAVKAHRQSLARRQRNRHHRSRLRNAVKSLRTAIQAGDAAESLRLLRGTLALVDRSAKLGLIHDNVAARTKSRLTRAHNALAASR
jgi:small subunit ribosomal protein S20